ncbi:hypothetical protein JCM9279_003789 [Rhodotorula babjevae]
MSNLANHGSPEPAATLQSQHTLPMSRFGLPDLPWPSSSTARAPLFDPSLDSPSPPSRIHPSPAATTSSSGKDSSSTFTSPATSFNCADSEGEQELKREVQVNALEPFAIKDKAHWHDRSDQAPSTSSGPARSLSDDYFSPTRKHDLYIGADIGLGIQVDHDGRPSVEDELASRTAHLDLRKTRSASPLEARRDSFTFFASPSLFDKSPSPRKPHPFSSSAALRSPQRPAFRREVTAPLVRLGSQGPEQTTTSRMRGDERDGLWRPATLPSTPLPHESPPLVPVPSRRTLQPRPSPPTLLVPPPVLGLDEHLFTSTRPAPLAPPPHRRAAPVPLPPLPALAPLPTPALSLADSPDLAHARPHTAYPLSPADTERIAQLHGGRVPSLQQLAPPQHEATAAAPVVNTGNVGPMVVQVGDWRCGVCAYIVRCSTWLNWRRRKICVKCFPHASDVGDILTIKSQQAASLARGTSSPSEFGSGASSSSAPRPSTASTSSAVLHGYFGPAPHASAATASSPPRARPSGSGNIGAIPSFDGSPIRSRPVLAPLQPPQSRPPVRPPLIPTRSCPSGSSYCAMSTPTSTMCDFRSRTSAPPPPQPVPPFPSASTALPPLPHNIWGPPSRTQAVLSVPSGTAHVRGGSTASAGDLAARQAATERVRAIVQARAASAAGRR